MDFFRGLVEDALPNNTMQATALVLKRAHHMLTTNQLAIQQAVWSLFLGLAVALVVSTVVKSMFNVFASLATALFGVAAFCSVVIYANPGIGKLVETLS